MGDDKPMDGALREAFGEEGESVLSRLGVRSRILLHDAAGDESPLLRVPASRSDQGAADDSRYQIVGEIARGGIGVIYKGRDKDLGRDVALKVLREDFAEQPEVRPALRSRRRRSAASCSTPASCRSTGWACRPTAVRYFAMKLIKGRTLERPPAGAAETPEPRRRLRDLRADVAQTMAYAHSRGVIHRDLKP